MRRGARLLLQLRPYTLLFVTNIVATLVASVMDGATFVLLIPFLRALFGQQALPATGTSGVEDVLAKIAGPFLAAGGGAPELALRNVVLVLLGALVLKNVAQYAAAVSSVAIEEGVVRDLRVRLFRHLQTLPLGFFQRTKGGQLLARVVSDTDQVKTAITAALASLLRNVSLIVVYVAILLGLSWRLTLIAIVAAPVLALIIRPMIARVRRRSREQADERGELTSLVAEMVAAIKLVRAYVAEAFEAERFQRLGHAPARGLRRVHRRGPAPHVAGEGGGAVPHDHGGRGGRRRPRVRGARPPARRGRPAGRDPGGLPGADRVPAGELLLRRDRGRGAARRGPGGAAGPGGGDRGAVRGGKDDARGPAAALLRAHERRHPHRRRADHAVHPREPPGLAGDRVAGDGAPERHRVRERRLRTQRLHVGAGAGRGARRQRRRVHRAAPRGLRHPAGRARHPALGRATPAYRDRARPVARPPGPDSRRGDERARRRVGAPGAGGDRSPDGAPHRARHRAPAYDRAARGSDRRALGGAHRGARDARRPVRGRRRLSAAPRHAVPGLTCSPASPSSTTPSRSITRSSPPSARCSTCATR